MLERIGEHTWFRQHEPASDRPCLGYISGEKYSFAVDAGASGAHVEAFYAELIQNGLRLPDFTGITHYHWDHSYGAFAVNGITIASDRCNAYLREEAGYAWDEEAMLKRVSDGRDIRFCYVTRKLEYPDPLQIRVVPADIEITSDVVIDLGGSSVRLIYCGGPHSADSVMFLCPEDGVLYLGDASSKDMFLNKWDYDENDSGSFDRAMAAMPHFQDRLVPFCELVKGLEFETAVFGHSCETISKQELVGFLEKQIIRSDT